MRLPVHVSAQSPWRKVIAILVIAVIAAAAGIAARGHGPMRYVADSFYDWFFQQRPIEDRKNSDTVIIAVDQKSLDFFDQYDPKNRFGWPWPRDFWMHTLNYLNKAGAKCVAFDLTFTETSQYAGELDDDHQFADALDASKVPVVLATLIDHDKPGQFAPPVKKPPNFGATNTDNAQIVQDYHPTIGRYPSLALAAVTAAGHTVSDWARQDFKMHYYGPYADKNGHTTFRYISAANVIAAGFDPKHDHGIKPEDFRDKIVLIGAVTAGTYDLKSSPFGGNYPGVELHATAIENMIFRQRVQPISPMGIGLAAILAAIAASVGSLLPRRWWLKLCTGLLTIAAVIGVSDLLFLQMNIRWLDPSAPLLASVVALILGLSWSYFAEDRQARFFLRALGQYLSPHVAAELRADPNRLSLSTESRELTILFSDIADFTTLSERLEEGIGPLLNYYLDEMSEPVLASDGTLDKYIGDAVMAFWNAPLKQSDHAARACRAALRMHERLAEKEVRERLARLGAPELTCRIGINTGLSRFGNMGSPKKFNYSAISDAVNFASRLEGANKFYGSRIMLGQPTAEIVRGQFFLRRLDVMRVKGKNKPAGVFELLGEGTPNAAVKGQVERYEKAFELYQAQDWASSERILLDVLREFPDDGPSQVLLKRVHGYRAEPPAADWDGVYVAKSK